MGTSGDSHVIGNGLVDFFSGLTALSVTTQQTSEGVSYSCQVTDGTLKGELLCRTLSLSLPCTQLTSLNSSGHTFTLTLDPSLNEFMYKPTQKSPHIPTTSVLSDIAAFPDYMLPRFLLNLLNTTFKQADS